MKNTKSYRLTALDSLRGLAVVLMIITHTRRLQLRTPANHAAWPLLSDLLQFFSDTEPFTLALFLFVAGFSAALSTINSEKPVKTQLKNAARRAFKLSALSAALFLADRGPQWPSAITSSGPLLVIALSTLVVTVCCTAKNPILWMLTVCGASLSSGYFLESHSLYFEGLNKGHSAFLNEVYFAAVGALCAFAYRAPKKIWIPSTSLGLFSLLGFLGQGPWIHHVDSSFWAYDHDHTIVGWVRGLASVDTRPALYTSAFWQYTTIGSLRLTVPLCVLFLAVFLSLRKNYFTEHLSKPFSILGHHALFVYIFHLGVLALVTMGQLWLPDALATWITVATLMTTAILVLKLIPQFRRAKL